MDATALALVVKIGHRLLSTKLFSVSMYFLWFYDYFLTLGDEINYAWSRRRSWVFALFIVNRYTPALHILYKCIVMFDFMKSMCLRVYAVTGGNKLLSGMLSILIVAQLGFGIYFIFVSAITPSGSLPDINLDAFRTCFPPRWRPGEVTFTSISVAFDFLTFLIILATAGGQRMNRSLGISKILDALVRDATVYFLLIVASQLVLYFFLFLAPTQIQLMPGLAHTMFLPVMTSRLMFSLRKAAVKRAGPPAPSAMGHSDRERLPGDGTFRFVPERTDVSHGASESLASPIGEVMELDPVPRLPRDRGWKHPY